MLALEAETSKVMRLAITQTYVNLLVLVPVPTHALCVLSTKWSLSGASLRHIKGPICTERVMKIYKRICEELNAIS
jgi:hypothetical protein